MYSSDQPPTTFSWRGFPVVWLFIHHQWISFMYLLSLPFNTYQLYASTKSLKKEFHRSVTHTLRSLLLLFVFSLAPGFVWQPLVFVLGHTVKSYPVSPSMSFLLQNEGPQPIHTLSVQELFPTSDHSHCLQIFLPLFYHTHLEKRRPVLHIFFKTQAMQACQGCWLHMFWQHPLESGPPVLLLHIANQKKCSTGTPATTHPFIYSTHLYLEPSVGYPGGQRMPPATG